MTFLVSIVRSPRVCDSHYIHVKRPSQLARDTNLYLFRDRANCAPMWEAFPNGGCWILKIKKKANVLGKMWQDLVLAAVGEAFEQQDVVGIAMAIRSKEDMLSVRHPPSVSQLSNARSHVLLCA